MRRAIEDVQNAGIEVDVWKIEGVDEQRDAAMLAEQARTGTGREGVTCVLLGRGASTEKVEHGSRWPRRSRGSSGSRSGARSGGTRSRASWRATSTARRAAKQIADNYLHFVRVYEQQAGPTDRARLHNAGGAGLRRLAARWR